MLVELEARVRSLMSRRRWEHTRGVVAAALQLASLHHPFLDPDRVKVAALLHDCAKDLPLGVQLKKAGEFGIVVTSSDLLCPQVLHGPVGAAMARYEFNIRDREITRAIAFHTTAGPRMSPLEKIIFVADYIEPARSFPGVEKLRALAKEDLGEAVVACMEQTLVYLIKRRVCIHPRMILARNHLLGAKAFPGLQRERGKFDGDNSTGKTGPQATKLETLRPFSHL